MNIPGKENDTDESALFRAAVGDVKPLPQQDRILPQQIPRQPLFSRAPAPDTVPDILSDHGAENAPDAYLSNGLSRMTLRKLRRGFWPVRDRLDLHGADSDTARRLLQDFLHEALQRGARCVLVVHGKGLNSRDGEAVLKRRTRHWLTQHPQVLAYCDAMPRDGGNGAVLVLLKLSP
ncbi:MAG: Smr/MutS family protein [Nitrosomonadales bacterium]|nr:Smr/MutS family protein [Nitrosomonadales bacterium]